LKYLCSILLALISLSLKGQNIVYRGVVTDSLGSPIPYVNLVAVSENTQQTKFTLTNNQGEFKIELEPNSTYAISLLHVSYERRSFILNTAQKDIRNELVLKEKVHELGEVEVTYQIPIQIKEDTVIYSVDAFANGQERKLKEVLRKMPGVEIDRDGTVKVMGKKVTFVLVEDKTFFNGTTKLAIDNIPADAVDKIEMVYNYNKVSFLKGLEDSDKLAMNIKLKEDKKRLLFGDLDAAGGHKKRYQVNPNLFLYNPGFSFNLLADVNNYGKKSLSLEDYLNFQNVGQFLTNSKGFIQGINDLSDYFFQQDYQSYLEKFGALNVQRSFGDKTDVNSFFMLSNSNTRTRTNTFNSFVGDSDDIFAEDRDQQKNTETLFALGKINLDHTASAKQFLNLNTSFRTIRTDEASEIRTISLSGDNRFGTLQDNKSNTIKQTLKYDRKLSLKHTLSLSSEFSFDQRLPQTNWSSPTSSFPVELMMDDQYRINQMMESQNVDFSLLLKDYYAINRLNHLYLSLGTISTVSDFITDEFQQRSDGSTESLTPLGFGNDLKNSLTDSYLGLEYKFKKKKFNFKPGLEFHHYLWRVDQSGRQTKQSVFLLLPKLNSNFQIGQTEKLELDYSATVRFPQTRQLAASRILQSFNSVYFGNHNLGRLLIHNVSLNFDKYKLLRGNSLSTSVQYSYSDKSIRNNIALEGINSVITPIEIDKPQSQLVVELDLGKRIGQVKYGYRINYGYVEYFQSVNAMLVMNTSNVVRNTVSLETLFEDQLNVNLSYAHILNRYMSTFTTHFRTHDLLLGLEYPITKKLLLITDYAFTDYKNQTANARSSFHIASSTLRYHIQDSPWRFEVVANNIFNTQFKQENTFNAFFVSDQRIFILPRILMLRVSYKL
jgi:hypothetical protein